MVEKIRKYVEGDHFENDLDGETMWDVLDLLCQVIIGLAVLYFLPAFIRVLMEQ